jgi:hemerythrin superfamily protein
MREELFQTLKKDHQEVKGIFSKLKEATQSNRREELLKKLQEEIIPHMSSEEKVLYTALKKKKEAKEDVLQSLEEHHAAHLFLQELAQMSPDDERFKAKVSVLMEMVDHHVEEEEDVIFKDIRKLVSDEEVDDLLKDFNKEKEKAKKSLH